MSVATERVGMVLHLMSVNRSGDLLACPIGESQLCDESGWRRVGSQSHAKVITARDEV